MGLFRLAAIVAVGVSLLPADREKQDQLYERAAAAANWTLTFCDRNAETCAKAQVAWTEFAKKAEFGAQFAYDVMRDKVAGEDAPERLSKPAHFEQSEPSQSGTLRPEDMQPAWRGKTANKAGI